MPLFRPAAAHLKLKPMSTLDYEELVSTIKTLFFRRYYKKCANRCLQYIHEHDDGVRTPHQTIHKQTLTTRAQLHPTYKIFLYFFAGVSNDCYARGMPSRSPLIPSTIDEAEEFFSKAQELVCEARIVNTHPTPLQPHHEGDDDSDDSSSSRGTHRSRHSQESTTMSRPSTAATETSTYSADNENVFLGSTPESKPSPLHVRKYQVLPTTPSKLLTESTSLFSIPPTSPNALSTSRPKPRLASFYLLRFSDDSPTRTEAEEIGVPKEEEDNCFHEPDHVNVYNATLASFSDMLSTHVLSLRKFRELTQSSNSTFRLPANRDSTGEKGMAPEERMERILRGRERKWARPRFNPQRYQDLCEIAIAEL